MITSEALALDYAKVEEEIVRFIRKVVSGANAKGAVIGLSGGIDSSVVGALLVRALGKGRVVGLLMPAGHTPSQDFEDAKELASSWGIRTYEVSIDPVFLALVKAIHLRKNEDNKIARANAKARIRMLIGYYYANALGMLVAGTGDKSEVTIGYYTKYGDGGVDFLPIAHLYKTQVRWLAKHLSLPESIVKKPSSPQLWPGHKATDEIPVDYDLLDVVLYGLFNRKLPPEEVSRRTGVRVGVVEKVLKMNRDSSHKRSYPPMLGTW